MFLLILTCGTATACTFACFKFHYVSINSIFPTCVYAFLNFFKFHYVSINSHRSDLLRSLHSALNSIMFLLIPFNIFVKKAIIFSFKFHYVSINSSYSYVVISLYAYFKFHYVSINSDLKNGLSRIF